jgi:hypothetical protein
MSKTKLSLNELTVALKAENYSITGNIFEMLFNPKTLAELAATPEQIVDLLDENTQVTLTNNISCIPNKIRTEIVNCLAQKTEAVQVALTGKLGCCGRDLEERLLILFADQSENVQISLARNLVYYSGNAAFKAAQKLASSPYEKVKIELSETLRGNSHHFSFLEEKLLKQTLGPQPRKPLPVKPKPLSPSALAGVITRLRAGACTP